MNKLIEGCKLCGHPLKLSDMCDEVSYELGSLLQITCNKCYKVTSVPNGKRHQHLDYHASSAFAVNTNLALGV